MKNKDILSFKLKEILEKEPLMGAFLENMAIRIIHIKNRNLTGDKNEVDELLNSLIENFEMMGIKEDNYATRARQLGRKISATNS